MSAQRGQRLIRELQISQQHISGLLISMAGDQDWKPAPDQWSFREVAAHLATCAKECVQPRIQLIAAGDNPTFDYYWNTGRDFGQSELMDSLREWAVTRQAIFDFVQALPEDKFALTGTHKTFGPITISDYLQVDLDHDREHLRDLEAMVAAHQKSKGPQAINFQNKLQLFSEQWTPKVIAQMNDYHLKLVKIQGEFVWHSHPKTDEVFIVLQGRMNIEFRDGQVTLNSGEMYVVPKGVEHKPHAAEECSLVLIEPAGTVNTGDAGGSLTAPLDAWI